MLRGIVLEKFRRSVAIVTPARDFFRITKDPSLCTIGEEVWFQEEDIIHTPFGHFFKTLEPSSVSLKLISCSIIVVLFFLSGLCSFARTGDSGKLKGDFRSIHILDRPLNHYPYHNTDTINRTVVHLPEIRPKSHCHSEKEGPDSEPLSQPLQNDVRSGDERYQQFHHTR